MTAERKRLSFGGGLLIYITVVITMLFVALAFWWHYLSCYETARVERVMDTYMSQTLETDLEQAILDYSHKTQTPYQSVQEVSSVLTEALGSDAWSYRYENAASTEDAPVYALYCGGLPVGQVRLTTVAASTLNMGFRTWENPHPTFDFAQFGTGMTITAPYGCRVMLNGKDLSEDAVQETLGLYPQLQAYEALITQPNQLLVYHVEEVFADVAVEYPVGYVALPCDRPNTYFAIPVCDDAMGEQMIDYAKNFVRAYVDYRDDATALWALQQFIVPESALYQKITEESAHLERPEKPEAEIKAIEIENFTYYGNAITCDASYIVTSPDADRGARMKLLLVNTEIGWRVIHME